MLTVNEVSRASNVTTDTVRHYVRIGLITPLRNRRNGYKLFNASDLNKIKFINRAKQLGFSLIDIGKILEHSENGKSPCPEVRKIIQYRIEKNKRKLSELSDMQQRMENALVKWNRMPDTEPSGHEICRLIESV